MSVLISVRDTLEFNGKLYNSKVKRNDGDK